MIDPWPWPVDTALVRARRVARSYRDALEAADPPTCRYLDAEMTRLGQRWVLPMVSPYDADDYLTADLVADFAQVSPKTVYTWRRKGLPAVATNEGLRFRFGDIVRWVGGVRDR